MDKEHFHNMILKVIQSCSYKFFVVQQDFSVLCPCTEHATKQADYTCKNCLGTGHKIKIRAMKGASQDDLKGGATMGVRSSRLIKNYFMESKYKLEEGNLIIDDGIVYYVHRIQKRRGFDGKYIYQEIIAAKQTNFHNTILNNFYEILNNAKKKK